MSLSKQSEQLRQDKSRELKQLLSYQRQQLKPPKVEELKSSSCTLTRVATTEPDCGEVWFSSKY
jgi:hypothetical protein